MSTAQTTPASQTKSRPSANNSPPRPRQLDDILADVAKAIAPVWPLRDYVAVNPFAGISHRSFLDVRGFLQVFSDCETLMPLEHYAVQFRQSRFTLADIESALAEMNAEGLANGLSPSEVAEKLMALETETPAPEMYHRVANRHRRIRTIAEYASSPTDLDWTETIVEEISRHCSAHFDQGQAIWPSPYRNLSLYEAWRTVAEHDLNVEILGLHGFRSFVAQLPHTPEAAIIQSMQQLNVPQRLWSTFLLCQAFSIPGWCAWAKYQTDWTNGTDAKRDELTGLLAIRLAYDAALSRTKSLHVNWHSLPPDESVSFVSPQSAPGDDSMLRYTLLRASEIAYRNQLLGSLNISEPESRPDEADQRKLAQMVFCIDVRSERFRRMLESTSNRVETMGFAGFFGMAFDYVPIGDDSGCSHLPVLLKPQFKVFEGLNANNASQESELILQRQQARNWKSLWKQLQNSAVGCFTFVETIGLFYAAKLFGRSVAINSKSTESKTDGQSTEAHDHLGPTLRSLNHQGMETSQQADLVEGMLRNLGLTRNMAKLVVFCGHASQTENNPLAAGLDCGACGGHSGEPNARFAALLLNQPYIRKALVQRGINIPEDTHFLGALHNTTTDTIRFFEVDQVPEHLQGDLRELIAGCQSASEQARFERLPIIECKTATELFQRASDWSEVRPEWGLAGNASFIAAPRSVTRTANLGARSFLHSYEHTLDRDGTVLETIMTAPMVVAQWINMQYYASVVDNRHFGSGTKTVHNVVGRFGLLSGNGGDLMTGLPVQSLSTGDRLQHMPLRLQVVISAPRKMIDEVVAKHELVADLLTGGWLHLIAIENEAIYRFTESGDWERLAPSPTGNSIVDSSSQSTVLS